jgi:hypothetical protein
MSAVFGARALVRFTVQPNEAIGIIRARSTWWSLKRAEARAPGEAAFEFDPRNVKTA